jgi:hypothetical protein
MRKLSKLAAAAALALSVVVLAPSASAADVKMIAHVTAITVAADGKSALVTVKNTKGGGEVKVTVTDPATLDKFAAKAIAPGDQVRLSYDDAGGGNLSKTFKKAEGC